jgi:uncharacterized protein YecE (DUF72 family)
LEKEQAKYYAGLSGLTLPVAKYQFPPEFQQSSRLEYYASIFNTIEINSSFYKVPQSKTVQKWSAAVPDGFKFTYKMWKQVTHCRGMQFEKPDVERFMQSIAYAGEKKGCLLIQFPPGASIESENALKDLLNTIVEIDKDRSWPLALEFRHRSWYEDRIYDLVDSVGATIVIHDITKSATPVIDLASAFIYVRFHGPTGNYRGSYDEEILSEHASYIRDWIEEGKTVYAYFNNTAGDAYANCIALNKLID